MTADADITILPAPRVRVVHEFARAYSFFGGDAGFVERNPGDLWFEWTFDGHSETAVGRSLRGDTAFLHLWCRAAKPPGAVDRADIDIDAVVDAKPSNLASEYANIYRRVLKQRTGFGWSVRVVGKGTARGTVRIMSAPRRQGFGGKMTAHDTAVLASIVGADFINPHNGVTVSTGQRRAMIYTLAGIPQPCAPILELAL